MIPRFLRPTVLHLYIMKEIALPFALGVFVLAFVALMPEMMKIAEKIFAFGISGENVIQVISYLLPSILLYVIPSSFLLAVLVAFGRLSAESEMIAMRAGGLSLWQLLPPVLALGVIASMGTAVFSGWGEPWGRYQLKQFGFKLAKQKAVGLLRDRTFNDDFYGKVIYADSVLASQGVIHNVFLADESDPKQSFAILAREGRVTSDENRRAVIVHLEHGSVDHLPDDPTQPVSRLYFDTLDLNITPDSASINRVGQKDPYEMFPGELYAALRERGKQASGRDWMAFHKKFAYPVSALLIGIVGMALGISDPRHGKGRGYLLGLMAMLIYYLLVRLGDATGEKRTVWPWLAAWLPNIVFAAGGISLFVASAREKETFLERLWTKITA